MLETPRSSRIASACAPFWASGPSTTENSPRRHHDPPLPVRLELRRRREEVALHHPVVAAERVERAEPPLDELVPLLARVDVQAPVHATCDDAAAGKGFPEPGWKGDAVLLI